MPIQVLDQVTIDKIAAGEVVERPASVTKELVENAIDAGATAITVEIKEGGISLLRVTDNGCGIVHNEVPSAFLRHSTSKIRSVDDLTHVQSLGFRGEALSSIAAIAMVELITKTKDEEFGSKYRIEGGIEKLFEETGAPNGTTFLVHQIFYNTPARRKFLKTPMTEASHVNELMTRLSLSHPEISFQFINNGQSKLHTSGNGKLKDVIYHIYGREAANNLLELEFEKNGLQISGYIGEPAISRGNRNFENYFINGRYVRNSMIAKAIEDAYKDFTMQHRFPFVVLHFSIDGEEIDVNVHPTKMELRFSNQQKVYNIVYEAIYSGLHKKEMIPAAEVPEPPKAINTMPVPEPKSAPAEPAQTDAPRDLDYFMEQMKERVNAYHQSHVETPPTSPEVGRNTDKAVDSYPQAAISGQPQAIREERNYNTNADAAGTGEMPTEKKEQPPKEEQLSFLEEQNFLKDGPVNYTLIGQVFETYWLVQFKDQLYIIDQHAAHERILYEKTLAGMKTREYTSQYITPPVVLDLSMQEAELLREYMDQFTRIGFEIESFGGDSYVIRAVPDNLFGIVKKEIFIEMLDQLADGISSATQPDIIDEKIASMSCKAAVKGNSKLSASEIDALIGDLLKLENPYHCPHGRPIIISMSKREMEKKFKRIV